MTSTILTSIIRKQQLTSLSSPTIPPPIHVLLSRHTSLHLGLVQDAVFWLPQFDPPSFLFVNRVMDEPDDVEDSSHEEADTTKRRDSIVEPEADSARATSESDKCPRYWFKDDEIELPLQWQLFLVGVLYDCHSCRSRGESNRLSWKIRVHFTNDWCRRQSHGTTEDTEWLDGMDLLKT